MRVSLLFLVLALFLPKSKAAEIPWDAYLVEGFLGNLNAGASYSQLTTVKNDKNGNDFVFLNSYNLITYGSVSIEKIGNGSIIMKFNSNNGELLWWQQLGDNNNYAWVNDVIENADGKFQILGGCSFSSGKTLKLGNQSFSFTANGTARFFTATFNPVDYTWSNVRFIINANESDGYIEQVYHFLDSEGNYFIAGKFSASTVLLGTDTIAKRVGNTGINIFTTKLSPAMVRQWSKYSKVVNSGTYLYNVFFESDGNGGAIIAGSLGYVTGALSFDGHVVKNDTISNAYDYSYHDIFVVNINAVGSINYAKTLLNRGNENITFLRNAGNGKLYLCGEYSGQMSILGTTFPVLGNSTYYNDFVSGFDAATGNFVWGTPLNTNIYYSERQRFFTVDNERNLYFSTRFANQVVNAFGQTYNKRNSSTACNLLMGKVNSSGSMQWANVLGAQTTFSGIIEHSSISSLSVGSYLYFSVPRRNYGTNKDLAWGPALIPETTMQQGYDGNMAVVDKTTGKLITGAPRQFSKITELNNNSLTGYSADYDSYQIYSLSLTGSEISGTAFLNTNPVISSAYTAINLLNANKNSSQFGSVSGTANIDQYGKYALTKVPQGDYFIQFVSQDSTLSSHYYKADVSQPVMKWTNATTVQARNNKYENRNIWITKTPYPQGISTVNVNIDISKMFSTSLWYFLNIECRLYDKSSNQLVAIAHPAEYSNLIYGITLKNVPTGVYRLEVEFPFITQVDIPELSITEAAVVTTVSMNVQSDKLYREAGNGISTNNEFNLLTYPNPAQDWLYFKKESNAPVQVKIYDIRGLNVIKHDVYTYSGISLNGLSPGVYIIEIDNQRSKFVKR